VYLERARSDAIIVGGNTLRRDNPQLTTRQEGGHTPTRIVVSRTLDLPKVRAVWLRATLREAHSCGHGLTHVCVCTPFSPQDANLWDVSAAPTIVMVRACTASPAGFSRAMRLIWAPASSFFLCRRKLGKRRTCRCASARA
jgi:hypothetical protein